MVGKSLRFDSPQVSIASSYFSYFYSTNCITYEVESGGLECFYCTFLHIHSSEVGAAILIEIEGVERDGVTNAVVLKDICFYFTESNIYGHCVFETAPKINITGYSCDVCGNLEKTSVTSFHDSEIYIENFNHSRCFASSAIFWSEKSPNTVMKFCQFEDCKVSEGYQIGIFDSPNILIKSSNFIKSYVQRDHINFNSNNTKCKFESCCFAWNTIQGFMFYFNQGSQSVLIGENNYFDNFSCTDADYSNLKYQNKATLIELENIDKNWCDFWRTKRHKNPKSMMYIISLFVNLMCLYLIVVFTSII